MSTADNSHGIFAMLIFKLIGYICGFCTVSAWSVMRIKTGGAPCLLRLFVFLFVLISADRIQIIVQSEFGYIQKLAYFIA